MIHFCDISKVFEFPVFLLKFFFRKLEMLSPIDVTSSQFNGSSCC